MMKEDGIVLACNYMLQNVNARTLFDKSIIFQLHVINRRKVTETLSKRLKTVINQSNNLFDKLGEILSQMID